MHEDETVYSDTFLRAVHEVQLMVFHAIKVEAARSAANRGSTLVRDVDVAESFPMALRAVLNMDVRMTKIETEA